MTRTLPALALLTGLLSACSGDAGNNSQAAPPPAQVTVATPVVQEIRDWDEYVGRFEAVQTVEVRPRASGYVTGVHFRDGDYVRAGQLLFTIDARQAQAQLAQAQAQLIRAQATLANARTSLARSQTLAAQQAESREELENRQAAVRTATADIQAAQAVIRARQLDIGFTRVVAPISGRISARQVDAGNAVTADQTTLTTIVSTDPLHFVFEGSEALLLRYQRQSGGVPQGAPVRIKLQDEADFVHAGRMNFIDNRLNSGSGTIRARALVPNGDGFLRPGMVGRLQLGAAAPYQALLVPETSIGTDATRRVVFLVGADGKLQPRPVELGPRVGDLRVIRSGIGPQDRVVIGGMQRAMPGQPVEARPGRIQAANTAQPSTVPAQPEAAAAASPSGQ